MAPKSRSSKSSSKAVAASGSDSSRSSRPRSSRVSAQSTARLGLLSGLIEGTLVMMELMFGLSIVQGACRTVYRYMNGLSAEENPPPWNSFCIHVTANIAVMTWLIFRMSQKHQPTVSIRTMADKLNLWPIPRSLSADSKSMIFTIFSLHFVGTASMFLVQYLTGHWIFSWTNYYHEERGIDYTTGVDMLLLAPVREELTFRGLMFTIFYLRGVAFKTAQPAPTPAVSDATTDATTAVVATTEESLAWTSSWKVDCIIASAVTFGFVHLLNLFGDRFTRTYIILQVFLGMTLGTFYCLRFVLSENAMLETVILHMINNFFSSFLPVEQELDLTDPLVCIPLSFTFLVYGTLAYRQYVKLMARPSEPFTVLTPIAPVVPPTATAPTTATEAILADEQQQQQQ